MPKRNAHLIAVGFVLAISGCGTPPVATPTAQPSSTGTPSATVRPPVPGVGPIEPGTYSRRGAITGVPFTFTMPAGWVGENSGITLSKRVGEPGREVSLNVYVIADIFTDACLGSEEDRQEVGETTDDLIRALMEQRNGAVISPIDIIIDGYPATRLDLTVPAELDLTTCRPPGPIGIQVWQDIVGKYFVLLADGGASLYVADIGGGRLVLTAAWSNGSSPDDIAEMEAIVDSIQIDD